ncbi:uncharacterized protein LOC124662247 [Lolium rigidum]|uniref:uncharacterized protein LOC124662247 n=1 Tax=Lolium rigidum TaxID=89674 RepID=UPI001F5E2F74|nr:uncharacterized protein LOC124662247 [Lolium rigidum]
MQKKLTTKEMMQSTPFAETIEKIQSGDYLYNKNVKELEAASNKAETEIQGADEKDVLKARRCSRLASQDSQKIEERPMERAKVKNLCADAGPSLFINVPRDENITGKIAHE